MQEEYYNRYQRQIILKEIGIEGQRKLSNASVLMIGAGGLGSPILLYLAAAGVGRIGIVDGDVVEESNLQRQVLYTTADVGFSKAVKAKEKLEALNPLISVDAYSTRLEISNALAILEEYEIIVDGSDNFQTRYLVNDACVILGKPLVFGSIFTFEGQVSVFNYKGGPTYRCLFPEPPQAGSVPNCSEIGVLGILPGIVGTLQANEVIKLITGIGEPLSGKLLSFDALSVQFHTLRFEANEENKRIDELIDYDLFCGIEKPRKQISASELKVRLKNLEALELIDVRSKEEFQLYSIGGKSIPVEVLVNQLQLIPKDKEVVLVCQSGTRSGYAQKLLEDDYGFSNLFNLKGGINDWKKTN